MQILLAFLNRLVELLPDSPLAERAMALVVALEDADPIDAEGLDFPKPDGMDDDAWTALQAIVAEFGNVDDEVLADARALLSEAAQADEVPTDDLLVLADIAEGVDYLNDLRSLEAEADDEARAEALRRVVGENAETEGDEDQDAEGSEDDESTDETEDAESSDEGDEGSADDGEGSDEDAPADAEQESVLAGGRTRISGVAARNGRRRQPAARSDAPEVGWQTLANVAGHSVGEPLDRDGLIDVFSERLADLQDAEGSGPVRVARLNYGDAYPADRTFTPDGTENARRVDAQLALMREAVGQAANGVEALTAAGGFCAPPQPLYDVPSVGSADRPVRNFLPSFNAARGGVTARPALTLAGTIGATDTDDSGIGTWSNDDDISALDGSPTKPVLVVDCGEAATSNVQAITARLQFGNFMDRFDPESVAAVTDLQEVGWARVAETALITAIDTASVDVGGIDVLSFARDLLNSIDLAAVSIRSDHRLARGDTLDVLVPDWAYSAIRNDLAMELPGAQAERLATADAQIDAWFAVRNVRVGTFMDTQRPGGQLNAAPQVNFPATLTYFIFDTGHHVFLDGGRLDLGVIRDSVLADTNDAQTFMESFEGLLSRGAASRAVALDVCVRGATVAPDDVNCPPGS